MGWSCTASASRVLDRWTKACIDSTGSQNTWRELSTDIEYFWETSRTEHSDGAITGRIFKMIRMGNLVNPNENYCRPSGTFRIEGDGTITRAPKFLKNA
jgi:hypothetical protein